MDIKKIEQVLQLEGIKKFDLVIENDYNEAQGILDYNYYTSDIDAYNAYSNRIDNNFIGTYKIKVERENDFHRFNDMVNDYKYSHVYNFKSKIKNAINSCFHDDLISRKSAFRMLDDVSYYNCDCRVCKFDNITFGEWKTGRLKGGQRLGKALRKAGFEQRLIDFYSTQIKDEKSIYLTISDRAHHIAGMSFYCELGTWDGYQGSSCQDPRHDGDQYPINLGGALHDDKLFVAFTHNKLNDLDDMEDKMLARSLLRYVSIDSTPSLIALPYYGNNQTKNELDIALKKLNVINVFDRSYRDRYIDDVMQDLERLKERANGGYELTIIEEVHVYDEFEDYVHCECPACGGDGKYRVYSERFDMDVEVSCPACGGGGEVETSVYIHLDEWIDAEITDSILPYIEGYEHSGDYVYINVNVDRVKRTRAKVNGLLNKKDKEAISI